MGSTIGIYRFHSYIRDALSRRVTNATVILVSLCFLDMAHTLFAVRMGIAREANPLMAPFIEMGDASFLLVKGASFVIPLTVVELLRAKKPKFTQAVLNLGAVAYPTVYILGSLVVHR
ncbi:MAG: DUF5658 family protein [Fimbriimonadaceae bacterium]